MAVGVKTNAAKIAELFFMPDFIRERPSIIQMFRPGDRNPQKRARRAAMALQTARADISTFPRPVLLLSGSEDRVIPHEATAALAEGIRQAQFVLQEGVGLPSAGANGRSTEALFSR
jgi:pimeloyl-ACP methyl ester carboxylesterase